MNGIILNTGSGSILTNVSSNAYYGYQPQMHVQDKYTEDIQQRFPNAEICNMDIQFSSFKKSDYLPPENGTARHVSCNRKRHWGCNDDLFENKKRRPNDKPPRSASEHQAQIPSGQKPVYLRKPTHNIPDLPRCIMEYNKDNQKNAKRKDEERKILEDILRETHGVSIYHWFCNEV